MSHAPKRESVSRLLRSWRIAALVLAAALAASCGGDSGPATSPAAPAPRPPPPPLPALAWSNVPDQLSVTVGASRPILLTLTPAVDDAVVSAKSDNSRVSVSVSASFSGGGGYFLTLMGESAGPDAVHLTATASGYQPAEAMFGVEVLRPDPPEPPGKAQGIRVVEAGRDYILWTWTAVHGATSYLVSAFPAGEGFHPADAAEVEDPVFRLDGLEPGARYRIFVRAVRENAGGRAIGPWSDQGTGETLPNPLPPAVLDDPRFGRRFWRQLVFDANDCPRTGCYDNDDYPAVEDRLVWVLATTSPNFYVRTHDDEGASTFSRSEITRMRRALPRITEALTGAPYRGRIVTGEADRNTEGWITIVEVPELDGDVCGRARVGALVGRIWMAGRGRPRGCSFDQTFVHEVGHALGFWHVSNPSNVMHSSSGSDWFTDRETFHAQVAYRLGRWHPYVDDRSRFMATQEPWPGVFEPPEPRVISCPPGGH